MFYFYSEGKKLRLPIKQIIYAEILNHDLYITTNGWGTVHSRMTLAAFLEKMPDNFIRIHRECTVAGNVVLPVARGMQKTIEKYFV